MGQTGPTQSSSLGEGRTSVQTIVLALADFTPEWLSSKEASGLNLQLGCPAGGLHCSLGARQVAYICSVGAQQVAYNLSVVARQVAYNISVVARQVAYI